MSRINEKLGLKPAGKLAMMHLPSNRHAAADLTSAKCPECGLTGAIEYLRFGERRRACTWCGAAWAPDPPEAA